MDSLDRIALIMMIVWTRQDDFLPSHKALVLKVYDGKVRSMKKKSRMVRSFLVTIEFEDF